MLNLHLAQQTHPLNAISYKRKKEKEDNEAHTSEEKVELDRTRSMRPRISHFFNFVYPYHIRYSYPHPCNLTSLPLSPVWVVTRHITSLTNMNLLDKNCT